MRALHLALALAAARAALQRAPCEHFIILKYAHTGSTWFVDELNGIDRFHVCPVPLTVRGTQALVSFAPLAFKLFFAARQNAVLRRSPFPSP